MKAKNMKHFHEVVCSRENYVCQGCEKDYSSDCWFTGRRNNYVCGHHIMSKGAYPELRLETENGACVCFECHELIHRGKLKPKPNTK